MVFLLTLFDLFRQNILENEFHALNNSKFSLADTEMTLNNTRLVISRGSSIFEVTTEAIFVLHLSPKAARSFSLSLTNQHMTGYYMKLLIPISSSRF